MIPDRPTWHESAACRGQNMTSLFFPDKGGTSSSATVAYARRVCLSCPVREQCAEAGIGELFGVWGGLSVQARKKLAAERPPVHGTTRGYALHRRLGEPACDECAAAKATYERDRYLRYGQRWQRVKVDPLESPNDAHAFGRMKVEGQESVNSPDLLTESISVEEGLQAVNSVPTLSITHQGGAA